MQQLLCAGVTCDSVGSLVSTQQRLAGPKDMCTRVAGCGHSCQQELQHLVLDLCGAAAQHSWWYSCWQHDSTIMVYDLCLLMLLLLLGHLAQADAQHRTTVTAPHCTTLLGQ